MQRLEFGRSPSRGAWIETIILSAWLRIGVVAPPRGERGLKLFIWWLIIQLAVAPPRGERGLKLLLPIISQVLAVVAPPRGERGLKQTLHGHVFAHGGVAPPRGERGLKRFVWFLRGLLRGVAPPRGERGLKRLRAVHLARCTCRSPSRGAWIETGARYWSQTRK